MIYSQQLKFWTNLFFTSLKSVVDDLAKLLMSGFYKVETNFCLMLFQMSEYHIWEQQQILHSAETSQVCDSAYRETLSRVLAETSLHIK